MPTRSPLVLLAGLLVSISVAPAQSIRVNETFSDGNRGAITQGADDAYTSLAWWSSDPTETGSLSAGPGSMTLHTGAGGVHAARHAVAHFPPATLPVSGSLTLTFNVSFSGISPGSTDLSAFRFGLYDSKVTGGNAAAGILTYTADGQNGNSNAHGYAVNVKPSDSTTLSRIYYGFRFSQWAGGKAPLLTAWGPVTYENEAFPILENGVTYGFGLRIDRPAADKVIVTYSIHRESMPLFSKTVERSTFVYTTFDTIGFSVYDGPNAAANIGVDTATLSDIYLVGLPPKN